MGKAKETERELAKHYFVDKGMAPEEVADKVNVTRNTVDRWAEAGKWVELRTARHASRERLLERSNNYLELLVSKAIEMENDEASDPSELMKLSDRISKANKAIETARAGMDPPLSVQLTIIGGFMDALLKADAKQYMALMQFHENYIYQLADRLS